MTDLLTFECPHAVVTIVTIMADGSCLPSIERQGSAVRTKPGTPPDPIHRARTGKTAMRYPTAETGSRAILDDGKGRARHGTPPPPMSTGPFETPPAPLAGPWPAIFQRISPGIYCLPPTQSKRPKNDQKRIETGQKPG